MATAKVSEFNSLDPVTGEPIWPPQRVTPVTVPGSMTTSPGTVLFLVTADVNLRMGVNEAAATYGEPIISAISNTYRTGSSAGETLNFIAE